MSSPLARVTEESSQPLRVDTQSEQSSKPEKLVSADTPRMPSTAKFDNKIVDTPVNSEGEETKNSYPKSKLKETILSDTEDFVASDGPTAKAEEAAAKGCAEMKDVAI